MPAPPPSSGHSMAPAALWPVLPVAMTRVRRPQGLTPMELRNSFMVSGQPVRRHQPGVSDLALKLCRSPQKRRISP